jgi:NAD(P)-dependent dehydrogenase (short-subunit alcohol dehydrogenase family)
MADPRAPVCVVVGVGPGNGAAFVRRFAAGGCRVALLARSLELSSRLAGDVDGLAWACDAGDPASLEAAFREIRETMGPPQIVIWNAGSGVWGDAEAITLADFEAAWRVNALGALACAREVLPAMRAAGEGAILFVGATASRRGGARAAAFAPAKAAQRSLAESLARRYWPEGVHVALMILDGVVDLPRTRERMPDKPDAFFIRPDDVAEAAWALTRQPRSAWSFEQEVRPFGETW